MADRVLIIEDEADLAELMALYLRRHGCEVTLAPSGRDGMNALRAMKPDLIVLDIGLPDSDGMEICREIRRLSDVPIIFVTCRRDADDIRDGLSLGADDYVTKPFDPAELVARVQGHLRKRGVFKSLEPQETSVWRDGRLEIDFDRMEIRADGRAERLFTKEMQLLKFLVQHPNRVFGLDELFESVWGLDSDSDTKTVYAHIHNLRRKLERNLGVSDRIVTIRGIGYKWVAE
jgi:DNA-binding response OmpR family regulator